MKKLSVNLPCVAAAAAMLLALGSASVARAQEPAVLAAHVPFAFIVGNTVLPAGNYIVKSDPDDDAMVAIQSTDGRQFVDTLTIPPSSENSSGQAQLVFKKVGNQYFLAQVAPADGETRDMLLTPATCLLYT